MINNAYNNYVRFTLRATNVEPLEIDEPIGWKDDDLELDRHKDYHGIFVNFTNNLKFTRDAKEYINDAYKVGGVNADLTITKEITTDNGNDIVWKTSYVAKADFNTMVIEQSTLSIKFNSNNLAELIKSNESDEFEIEKSPYTENLESIDGDVLPILQLDTTEIKGRDILSVGEYKMNDLYVDYTTTFLFATFHYQWFNIPGDYTFLTQVVSEGAERCASVDISRVGDEDTKASNMFYVDRTAQYTVIDNVDVNVSYDLEFELLGTVDIQFIRYLWNGSSWVENGTHPLGIYSTTEWETIIIEGKNNFLDIAYNEGLMLVFRFNNVAFTKLKKHTLIINEDTRAESSPNLNFIFAHDLYSRLLSIITGRQNVYKSKFFGRTELGYTQDGEAGLIGVMSGLWARAFDRSSEKYKGLKISLKDLMKSTHSVFNTGIGIVTENNEEIVREEDLKYFYQNEVAVKLPFQISNVKRTVDKDLFFSGMSFGYEKAGDYEDSIGLDEPNTRTEYVTPIRKSTKKFKKLSKVRTDEYGLELARRKPQVNFPDEDTRYDEGNWFLDLKRTDGLGYVQKEYTDRLQDLPSGVHSPSTYRSMFFTPLRMLFRHSWVFRSGLEPYLDKYVRYISAVSNSKLVTQPIGWDNAYAENDNVLVRDVDRPRFLPEIVEFTHPVSDELMAEIQGTTNIEYEGENEDVPNVYFKFEYTNENGNLERGYLLNLKPNKEGKWKMQLSNENIIL